VYITQDVKFDESTLYHQLLQTKPAKMTLEPSEQDKNSQIEGMPPEPPQTTVQPPNCVIHSLQGMIQSRNAMRESPKPMVYPPKAAALPPAITPIDNLHDDLTPPPQTLPREPPSPKSPPPNPGRSGRTAANISIAMMIKPGPKTYCTALNAEGA
jgi:hypothetical protein